MIKAGNNMSKKNQKNKSLTSKINDGEIKNLADIEWRYETEQWDRNRAKNIIDSINERILKCAVITAMLSEWLYNRTGYEKKVYGNDFFEYLNGLKKHLTNYELFNIETIKKQQNKEIEKMKKDIDSLKKKVFPLPKELDTNEYKALLQKTITAGLCDNDYKWNGTKSLLAYFADRASEYLGLCKGEYDGKPKTSWKPFETLFGISGLSGAKRDYQKTGTLPDGYKAVNKLFE